MHELRLWWSHLKKCLISSAFLILGVPQCVGVGRPSRCVLGRRPHDISHFILERGIQLFVSLRHRWRFIYSERGLLLAPYLLPGARGCQRLHPLASRIVRDDTNMSDQWRIPGLTLDSDWTDCLNLTAWFSYHVVSFWLHTCSTGLPPTHCHPPVY